MDNNEILFSKSIIIEKKKFYFDVKENNQGKYLRITEKGNNHKNRIIVPIDGIQEFKQVLEALVIDSEKI